MVLEYLIQNRNKNIASNICFVKKDFSITQLHDFNFLLSENTLHMNAILVFEFAVQRCSIDLPRDSYHNEMCIKCECLLFDGILEYVL